MLKNNADLALKAKDVKRTDWKTLVGSYMLDPTMTDVYQTLTHKVASNQRISKKEKWVSWTKLLTEWSEDEIWGHLSSGRFISKECVETPGVWLYQDTMDFKTEKHLDRDKEFSKSGSEQLRSQRPRNLMSRTGTAAGQLLAMPTASMTLLSLALALSRARKSEGRRKGWEKRK